MAESGNYQNTNDINDGFFELDYRADGIYLVVYPPVEKGKKVQLNDILGRISGKKLINIDKDAAAGAVYSMDRKPVRIAEMAEENKVDAAGEIFLTPDKMKAYITIRPPEGGRKLLHGEILDLLKAQGVVFGINDALIEELAGNPVYKEEILVAEGTSPVNGRNGTVQFNFDIEKQRHPKILEDGRVDYRELNLVQSVGKGDLLCSLTQPVPGVPGKDVTGAVIPALNGKPANMPKGKNVTISDDGQYLFSNQDGEVCYIDGKISVFAIFEVLGDVDNSTGNVYFIGNICIRGNVLSGFSVEAGGNVEVWGVVEGAHIKAGGDIILRRGMQGIGKGALISGGNIIARYIEHSSIEARNDIKSEAIMHSTIKCGGRLELGGNKGLLVGGSCKVGKEVIAKTIGSHMATVTDIEVGIDPADRERYKVVKEESASIENDIKKAEQAIVLLKKLESAGALTPEKHELMLRSIRTKLYLNAKLNEIKDEVQQLEQKLQQNVLGKVRAYNFIYPGTRVSIGSCTIHIKENLQYCTLFRDGADIRVGAIDK